MGCITLFCSISGLPLVICTYFDDEDILNKKHPNYGQDINSINKCNDKKYNHLNVVVVVLPDSSVSSKGDCDGYGLVKICDSDQVYDCRQSNYWKDEPIAISNSIYMLMKDDPRFLKLIEEKTLFKKLKSFEVYFFFYKDLNKKSVPYLKQWGEQIVSIGCEEDRGKIFFHVNPKDLWSYVDPFLIEKVDEPFLGKTRILQKYRKLNGKKSKLLYKSMINNFLNYQS